MVDPLTNLQMFTDAILVFVCQDPPGWPVPPKSLWESTVGFITAMLGMVFAIGAASRSLAVGSVGAYTMFVHYGVLIDNTLITQVMYVAIVMVTIGIGLKLWKIEGPGGGAGA